MYLKSLVLKGFKSFADRSVLSLEPGITVIVGPNGSGKSNISDSILWVLGEQSAKTLRGQSMEDVIFSGSSARKAVGIAEVDLVLDNSCGTLPLDFQEVCITRRMYRSGESEYLINGSPCLLRDVLDILHDSGLGRDAQSIISQGSLGSVLQSKPEDRRALIEEAAGTLKHKKRKERANRKLAAMDVHLTRVNDLAAELDRQLRPLERQASKARQFRDLSSELKELHLQLAVDDLRSLEAIWKDLEKRDKEINAEVDLARYRYAEKERELNNLQRMLEEKGLFVGDLAEQRRRCQSVLERFDSNKLLLEEKGRNMVARISEMRAKVYRSQSRYDAALAELKSHREERENCCASLASRSKELSELNRESEAVRKARSLADDEFSRLSSDLRGKQRAIEDCKLKIEKAKSALSANTFESEMLNKRLEQISESIASTQNVLAARRSRLDELDAQLAKHKRESEQARFDIDKFVRLLEGKQSALAQARETQASLRAEIKALEEIERAFESTSPALSWLLAHQKDFSSSMKPISELFSSDSRYEKLLERLLGGDIFGIMVDDSASAAQIGKRLMNAVHGDGEVSLLPVNGSRPICNGKVSAGIRLLDQIHFDPAYTAPAEALLGDIYLVDSLEEAIAANAGDISGARFVTMEGAIVWPNGKISMGKRINDMEGVLARRRRLDTLNEELLASNSALAEAEMAVSEAESTLALAQQDDFELSTSIAQLQGECDSIRSESGRLEQSITNSMGESTEIKRQLEEISIRNLSSQPLIAEMEQRIVTITEDISRIEEKIAAGSDSRLSSMNEEAALKDRISKCNVDIATCSTREVFLKQRIAVLEDEVLRLEKGIEISRETQLSLDVLSRRVEPLHDALEELSSGVRVWANKLRDQAHLEQSNSSSLIQTINEARESVRSSKEALDQKLALMADLRVDKGKIEIQVDAAIKSIVEENGILIERALQVPPVEDRNAAEARELKLRRRIDNLGLVNQVAMEEYEALKRRREYIGAQLEDLSNARAALSKIVVAIDRKMRRQFLETFEIVDNNFQEIFSQLFPGGNAHLSLTDPENPESTGIEIFAQPLGKKITKTTLMSGGEKSLTAMALLFAVYRTRTVSFYVLDEVDDALDDSNLRRLVTYLDSVRHNTQFLIVTHARRTMEMADVLYGVSMQADGVSKVVSQKLERAIAENASDATPEDLQAAIDANALTVRPVNSKFAGKRAPAHKK